MKATTSLTIAAVLLAWLPAAKAAEVVSLAGPWRCALDARNEGEAKEWFKTKLADSISLPGTTDEARMGVQNTNTDETRHLSRVYRYSGPAWYQRDVVLPERWQGKTVTLLLERTKNSRVWIDDRFLGEQDSLAAPHVYVISGAGQSPGRLVPGTHRLTICVNNAKRPPVNGGHQLSDETQTNWNGIIGRIELEVHGPAWIARQRVFANNDGNVRVEVEVNNELVAAGRVDVAIAEKATGRVVAKGGGRYGAEPKGRVDVALKLDGPPKLWSEFTPDLYIVKTRLLPTDGQPSDTAETTFGFREFTTRGTQFSINGRTTFSARKTRRMRPFR